MAIPHRYISSHSGASTPECKTEDLSLTILPETPQLKVCFPLQNVIFTHLTHILQGIFTILRSKDSSRQDFIFFADRLATILVETALRELPHCPKTVITPVGAECVGQQLDAKVSPMRSCPD